MNASPLATCARGFRVPALFGAPDPFTKEMLGRIRAVLVRQRGQTTPGPAQKSHIARDEAVTVPGPGNRIDIGGLAASLSNGEYSGNLRSVATPYSDRSGIPLHKSGHSIALTVPGPGLYLLAIFDSMKWPRIQFMIAVAAAQNSELVKNFQKEHALLAKWNQDYFGWPMHDFQRDYLKSVMLDIRPPGASVSQMQTADPLQPGVTAEPTFTPRPGIGTGNNSITLHCVTPGATIHYTVDTTQPRQDSPAYHAPIIMKNMPLTIKAFAEAPGKKDSAVVTGNFRVNED